MPIYEYVCMNKHVTERIELISLNTATIECPVCSRTAAKITSRSSWKFGKLDNGIHVTTTKSDTW